jgi:hypothetical protein
MCPSACLVFVLARMCVCVCEHAPCISALTESALICASLSVYNAVGVRPVPLRYFYVDTWTIMQRQLKELSSNLSFPDPPALLQVSRLTTHFSLLCTAISLERFKVYFGSVDSCRFFFYDAICHAFHTTAFSRLFYVFVCFR